MKTGRTFWFIIAALCVAAAVVIFAGRTMLAESLGDPTYRALIITAYVLLGEPQADVRSGFRDGRYVGGCDG